MKKVLFATTALIATAGVAAADVTLSGSAEMGFVGGDTITAPSTINRRDGQFHTDIDVTFGMSGETDTGLAFGASVDLDEAGNLAGENDNNTATVFISGAWGRLTMGDADTAFDVGVDELAVPGTIDAAHEGTGWSANAGGDALGSYDGQNLLYTYSIDGIGFAFSLTQTDNGTTGVSDSIAPLMSVGVSYDSGPLALGLGFSSGETTATTSLEIMGGSVQYNFNDITLSANASTEDRTGYASAVATSGFAARYTMDALTIGAHLSEIDNIDGVANDNYRSMGLSANYALGGGATIQGGFSDSENTISGVKYAADRWSLGIAMSF